MINEIIYKNNFDNGSSTKYWIRYNFDCYKLIDKKEARNLIKIGVDHRELEEEEKMTC